MAKKRSGKTKADSVREYMAANPSEKSATVISKALAAKGVKISVPQVYGILNKKSGVKKKNKAASNGHAESGLTIDQLVKTVSSAGGLKAIEKAVKDLEAVQESQKLIDKIGGLDAARKLVSIK